MLVGILLYLLVGRAVWWPLLTWIDTTIVSSDGVLISLESMPVAVKSIAWLGWGVLACIGLVVLVVWLLVGMFTLLGKLA